MSARVRAAAAFGAPPCRAAEASMEGGGVQNVGGAIQCERVQRRGVWKCASHAGGPIEVTMAEGAVELHALPESQAVNVGGEVHGGCRAAEVQAGQQADATERMLLDGSQQRLARMPDSGGV